MNDVLDRNLAALHRVTGVDLSRALSAADRRRLLTGHGDALRLRTAAGGEVRLGSARNPRAEAEALLAAALGGGEWPETVAIIGAGTGAVLEALEAMPVRRILVIEAEADLAVPWLSSRSWIAAIDAGRLRLIVGPDYVGAADAARFLDGTDRLPVVAHPVLLREYPGEMAGARRVLDRVLRDAGANANARERFEDLALANTLRNLPAVAAGADVEGLSGRLTGLPAIVVGAGPSLDDNLAAIRAAQARAVVIATDTALLPCLRAGIVPPLVVALDPSEANGRHLIAAAAATATHLVTEASVDPAGIDVFAGRTFVFRVGDHAPWPWLVAAGAARGRLSVWGSVATAALSLALKAGCSSVAFAGLDLAYTAGRPYCRGTVFEEGWAWAVARGQTLQQHWDMLASTRQAVDERDVGGRLVPSAPHLQAFRDWIRETAAARPDVRFANVTGAGILHGAPIAQQSLEAFLGDAADIGPGAAAAIRSAHEATRSPGLARQLAKQLASAQPLDVVRGHSAASRAAIELSPQLIDETVRRLEAGPPAPATVPSIFAMVESPVHLPEQAAILTSLSARGAGAATTAAATTPPDAERARALFHDAFDRLGALLPHAHGVRSPHPPEKLVGLWSRVPARLLFDWPRGVVDAVDAFGSRLAEAARAAGGPRLPPAIVVPSAGDTQWSEGAVDPRRPAGGDPASALAAAALTWQWTLAYAATVAADDAMVSSVETLLHAPPLLAPWNRPATRLTAWLVGPGPGGAEAPVPWLSGLTTARALTGVVGTRDATRADPGRHGTLQIGLSAAATDRLRTVRSITPDSLVTRGHPRAHYVAAGPEDAVLVGRSDGSGIAVMSEAGEAIGVEAWPMPARASIRYGTHARLAWHFPDAPRLLHRDLVTGRVDVIELPVTVIDAVERPDGSVLLATDDGLWTWRPDGGARPLVRGPWLVALWAHGEGVQARVRPDRRREGQWDAASNLLQWAPGDETLHTVPVAPGTAPFGISGRAGWRAEAWLDACLVRIVRPDGRVFWLACGAPRSLAWAGATLYVATIAGEVLRFPALANRLAAA